MEAETSNFNEEAFEENTIAIKTMIDIESPSDEVLHGACVDSDARATHSHWFCPGKCTL